MKIQGGLMQTIIFWTLLISMLANGRIS